MVTSNTVFNDKDSVRRRILYTQRPSGGGSTTSLYELVKGLDAREYEPIVLFFRANKYLERFKQLGIKILTLDISKSEVRRRRSKHSLSGKLYQLIFVDTLLALRVAYIIKKEKINLVHQNLGLDRPVMMAAWLTKTPQICHFRHFSDKLPLIRKRMAVRVDAALYTTQAIADSYLEKGIPIANWDIVYEPIDVHRFSESRDSNYLRQQLSIGDDEYLISNIGRITSWKGQYYFLQAVEEIIAQFPNTKALIVGEPGDNTEDKAYFTSLQEMSKKASIRDHIIFTGNRDDIAAIMAASDIVVHSACRPEPFGLVIAEAMATGTPVIATRGGGTTEIIQDGVNGLLVPMSSSSHIKYAIQRLLESENLRASLSAAALEEVTERFTIEQHVSKVQAFYERICAAR